MESMAAAAIHAILLFKPKLVRPTTTRSPAERSFLVKSPLIAGANECLPLLAQLSQARISATFFLTSPGRGLGWCSLKIVLAFSVNLSAICGLPFAS